MMPFRRIRLVMGRAHGLGISTACYPSPAPVHGLLSSDNERLKLCPRVQTPAPVLGRLHATVPVSWLCWWCVAQGGRLLSNPQPPTSPANVDPDGLYQTWWWGSAHSITRRHVRFLRLHPADGVHLQPPYHRSVVQAAESTSHPLHCLGHNALFCCPIPTQGSILLSCLALMTARLVGTVGSIW